MLNVFSNNRFRRIFARTAGIYELGAAAFQDIRFALEGNTYHEIFAETGGIIHLEQKGQIGSGSTLDEYLLAHNQAMGFIQMKGEIVSECSTMG